MSNKVETIKSTKMTRREQLRLLGLGHKYGYVGHALVSTAKTTFRYCERGFATRAEAEQHGTSITLAEAERAFGDYGPVSLVGHDVEVRLAHVAL